MFFLEKYNGSGSRHDCPACGAKKRFTRYVDTEKGDYLADHVGRCDRESSCGYHYKPKEHIAANGPSSRTQAGPRSALGWPDTQQQVPSRVRSKATVRPVDFIDKHYLIDTLTDYDRNAFVQFLFLLFPFDAGDVWEAVSSYLIGTHKTGKTIFWQIDQKRRIRTGKAIAYDRNTGRRYKHTNPFFLHPKDGFELQQCFFGEHLLAKNPDLPIAITEAEKSAVIASLCKGVFPEMVWLACGGKSHLTANRIETLGRDRRFILYPDADGFDKWQGIALEASKRGMKVSISSLIERFSAEAERKSGYDIADYLIREQMLRNDLGNRNAFRDEIEERLAIMTN